MNFKEIESLKVILSNMAKTGCKIEVPAYGIRGRILGVGYKPYWTTQIDSKIEKLEINIADENGRIVPFSFLNVTGFSIVSNDGERVQNSNNVGLDIQIYAPIKERDEEPIKKIRVELSREKK